MFLRHPQPDPVQDVSELFKLLDLQAIFVLSVSLKGARPVAVAVDLGGRDFTSLSPDSILSTFYTLHQPGVAARQS